MDLQSWSPGIFDFFKNHQTYIFDLIIKIVFQIDSSYDSLLKIYFYKVHDIFFSLGDTLVDIKFETIKVQIVINASGGSQDPIKTSREEAEPQILFNVLRFCS